MSGEYSVSLLQELLSQRTHWNEEKQELIHQLEVFTQQVTECYGISCVMVFPVLSVISGVFYVMFGTFLYYVNLYGTKKPFRVP